jgi:putative membrane protein
LINDPEFSAMDRSIAADDDSLVPHERDSAGDRRQPRSPEQNPMSTIRIALAASLIGLAAPAAAQDKLDDLEMTHVAVTASNIDIAYAHLALAFSDNQAVRDFAQTMIRDHAAVNEQIVALAKRLGVQAKDNEMSSKLLADAAKTKDELSRLRGSAFDRRYLQNEQAYHRTVNGVVEHSFIPNIQNPEVKQAFQAALRVFREHERHAGSALQSVATR